MLRFDDITLATTEIWDVKLVSLSHVSVLTKISIKH